MPVLSNATLANTNRNGSASVADQLRQTAEIGSLAAVGFGPAGRQNTSTMFKYNENILPSDINVKYPSDPGSDWRVRISLPNRANYFNNSTLLSPLFTQLGGTAAGGAIGGLFGTGPNLSVIFPYTPNITIQHTATYSPQKLTHSNYTQHFYDSSAVEAISITADFTVQNIHEGQYLLAAIYFFRSVTKMFFGRDPQAGNPPPITYLNGYGQYYLPNVPCVVTSFSHTMPADVDYIDVPEPGIVNVGNQFPRLNSTRLPTTSQITLTLQPIYSRLAQSQKFSLIDFANGGLINAKGSGSPSSSFGRPGGALAGGFL